MKPKSPPPGVSVEYGRGNLGHPATLRFPSPLIEPDYMRCAALAMIKQENKRPNIISARTVA